jgi:hypothetical protein
MLGGCMLLANVVLALVLGSVLGVYLSYPLLGAAGGVLAAIGGRVELGRKRTATYDEVSGKLQRWGEKTPAYKQLGYMLRGGMFIAVFGCLGGVLGLFFGETGEPWGAAFGAVFGALVPFCEAPLVGHPNWDHGNVEGDARGSTLEEALERGIAVNPDHGIWLGQWVEED